MLKELLPAVINDNIIELQNGTGLIELQNGTGPHETFGLESDGSAWQTLVSYTSMRSFLMCLETEAFVSLPRVDNTGLHVYTKGTAG